MEYLIDIQQNHNNPEGLEALYQFSRKEQSDDAFKTALFSCYETAPDNLLYAAWFHRLHQPEPAMETPERVTNWKAAISLALLNGLLFWYLSNDEFRILNQTPALTLFAAPLLGLTILAYLIVGRKQKNLPALGVGAVFLALPFYSWLIGQNLRTALQETYLVMAIPHIALLVWIGIGWSVLGPQTGGNARVAFMHKSFEVVVTTGLFFIAGGIFSGIAIGMFDALGVDIPLLIQRLIFAGGAGIIPVLAVAAVYDPQRNPADQTFGQGVSRLMPTLVRFLLPATVLVLLIYVGLIPFNFRAPIENRDVLILNNGMLFAMMGLLVGATPLNETNISFPLSIWTRRGIIAVAVLAILVSLHSLTAILFRTFSGALTMNRTIVIGWNLANLSLLIVLLSHQFRRSTSWITSLHHTFNLGSVIYLVWGLLVVLAIPLLY